MSEPIGVEVTPEDERPARRDGTCFYCSQPFGQRHTSDCVLLERTALVRFTITVPMEVSQTSTKESWEFMWNEGTHCFNNLVEDLRTVVARLDEAGYCLCGQGIHMVTDYQDEFTYAAHGVPWSLDGVDARAEWLRVLDSTPHRLPAPQPVDETPDEKCMEILAEIANRRCREGIDPICAQRYGPEDRQSWCEPCLAAEAFTSDELEDTP